MKKTTASVICVLAFLLVIALLFAPLFSFRTSVATKSVMGGTPGDEKCLEAIADLESKASDFNSITGLNAQIEETVVADPAKVVYTLYSNPFARTGISLLSSGVFSGTVLWILLGCALCAFVFALPFTHTGSDERHMPHRVLTLRTVAPVLALIAFLLIPVLAAGTTVSLSRIPKLVIKNLSEQTDVASSASGFLFSTADIAVTKQWFRNLTMSTTPWFWCIGAALLALLVGALALRYDKIGHKLARGLLYAFIIAMCVIILYPYYVMLITGLRSNAEAADMNFLHLLPTEWIFSNLTDIVARGVLTYMGNSLLLSFGATAIALICGIPAAYAMARFNFKGKKLYLGFVIMSQMFSPVVLLVGISRLMVSIHLDDSVIGLMLINAAFNQAFAIWLLRGTFLSISPEMEQAAHIDGCTTFGAMLRILLPMAAPGIVTTLIFVFINSWNEFTISNVLITTTANKPITVGITQFSSYNMIEWQYLFASSLLATIPVVILFMCIEKHLAAGLTAGGVKG